jgi:hypothetical protein
MIIHILLSCTNKKNAKLSDIEKAYKKSKNQFTNLTTHEQCDFIEPPKEEEIVDVSKKNVMNLK